jgi:acyl-CoA synthetase (AMP-forming)/AMP-acid ligase II
MEHFDPEDALRLVERHRVTHSQWVPTMFVRMLKLPDEVRTRYDLSSHRCAIHAAAPCPVEVKQKMIEWWGPIIEEYYSATEGMGATYINSEQWLTHRGSVGRTLLGPIHILDEDGHPLPNGEVGTVWFEPIAGRAGFEYHNDPDKTKEAHDTHGWATVGDMGYLDDEGFLYLTDRRTFMIVSGGVNIYPQEIENLLINHPRVFDVAVFGVPNAEMGEEVKAVVQPLDMAEAGPELERELGRSAASTSRTTSARARSTSRPSCRASRRGSSTSGCCATATGATATRASSEWSEWSEWPGWSERCAVAGRRRRARDDGSPRPRHPVPHA